MKLKAALDGALAKNAGWMLAGQMTMFVAQAAYFLVLARLLGSSEYGIFVGAAAMVSICSNFSSLGSGTVLLRYVSSDHTQFPQYWGNAIGSTLAAGTVLAAFITLAGPVLLHTDRVLMLALIAFADCICMKLADCAGQAFQAFEQLRLTAILNALTSVLRLLAALCLWITLKHATAMEWAAAAFGVSVFAVTLAVAMVCRNFGMPRFSLRLMVSRIREGLGFSVAYSTTSIYNDVDKAMLTHYGMYAANGAYSLAYRIVDIACMPIKSLHSAAMPRFFRAGTDGVYGTAPLCKKILKRTLPYGIAAAAGMFLFAPVVPMLTGKSFGQSASALRWLCLIPAIRTLHLSAGDAITSAGYQRLRTGSQFAAAGLNFCLNLYLIPNFSWLGAAWASLLTDGVLAVGNWVILSSLMGRENRVGREQQAMEAAAK